MAATGWRTGAQRAACTADALDNGQHILIGAYQATLELMHHVGADARRLLQRLPLALQYPDGQGLRLRRAARRCRPSCAPCSASSGWTWAERLSLLSAAARLGGTAIPVRRHAQRGRAVPAPAGDRADATDRPAVCGRAEHARLAGQCRRCSCACCATPCSAAPARRTCCCRGAPLERARCRSRRLPGSTRMACALHTRAARVAICNAGAAGWQLDGQPFDAVVLACSAAEAARLCADVWPGMGRPARRRLRYEPIVTVYLQCPGARLALPMMALHADAHGAGAVRLRPGRAGSDARGCSPSSSAARADWVERGLDDYGAGHAGAGACRPSRPGTWPQPPTRAARRPRRSAPPLPARRACNARRPAMAPGLWAAGDYVAGPYPATLEGAVRSGRAAAQHLTMAAQAA